MNHGLSRRISKGDCLDGDNTVEGAMPALGNGEYLWFGLVRKASCFRY